MSLFFILFTILWVYGLIRVYQAMSCIPKLDQYQGKELEAISRVSIIIAVKDGEKEIEGTLKRLLNYHYPNLEIIVVNDRSTDRTFDLIQTIQLTNPSVIGVHIKELPEGWLGKVHALHEGIKHATGEYVLFMDADVVINEDVLKTSLIACQENNLDHLSVLPEFVPGEYLLNVMTSTSTFLFILSSRPWLTIAERPVECIKGVGAYNLIKRSSFEKTEGFTWLKMDVADDVALAQLLAKNGGRSLLMRAGNMKLELDWYENFKEYVRGLEKNIVGGFTNYRPELIFSISLVTLLISVVPLFALLNYKIPVIFYSGIGFFISTFIFTFLVRKMMNQSFITLLAFPLGITLLGLILLRSALLCFKNGGIKWRGTFYPLKELKEGSRVQLGL